MWVVGAIVLFIGVMSAAIFAVAKFRGENVSAVGVVMGVFFMLGAYIYNIIAVLYNKWTVFAEFLVNVLRDPIYTIKKLFVNLGNNVLDIVNNIAQAIDTVFGSNLSGAVTSFQGRMTDWLGEMPEGYKVIKRMEMKSYADAYQNGYDWFTGLGDKFKMPINNNEDGNKVNLDDWNKLQADTLAPIEENTKGTKNNTDGLKDELEDNLDTNTSSESARFAWYKENNDIEIFDWTSVQYYLSFGKDFINIVLQGDPSIDIEPYDNYLISYAYIGAIESFEDGEEDKEGNFGLTVSSDIFPEESKKYGEKTANCITDIGMFGTKLNSPFQSHLIKFSTNWGFSDKNFMGASRWTKKHHMSEVIFWHPYDGERGKLQNVLIGDRSSINHSDILVEETVKADGTKVTKKYIMLNINAPYSILNNSPNTLYGIALRKE